jgi:glycosyltransferase involved in cell wall biosynthesis
MVNKSICHISPTSIHSTRWIEAFHQKGYNVSLITDFKTWVAQKPRNTPIYVLPTLIINNVQRRLIPNYTSMFKILRKIKPDLVHLHTQHHYAPIVIRSDIPYILHSWGFEVLELQNMTIFRKTIAKYAAMKAQKVIVDAECMKKTWMNFGVPRDRIEVIPFGVDTNLFKPNTDNNEIRKKLEITENDIVVISTRPFFSHYNVECLIKAASLILKKHKNTKFIIKGKGPLENYLRKLAENLGVNQHIRFSGAVQYKEMVQYLATADVYVSTSFIDSTSVSMLEAMACGLPPITTDIVGNREWIQNGVNGLLYPPKDHVALAEKITQLIEQKNQRKQFGEKSRRIIIEKAAWEKCVSKMEAIYQSLTTKKSRN